MKIRAKIILAAVLFAVIAISSYLLIRPTSDAWAAEGALAKSDTFGFGPLGATAKISEDELQFFRILQSPKSHLVFRHLYDTGTPEAKAFAIIGLKQTLLGRADERMDDFARLASPLQTQSGCNGGDCTPKELLAIWDPDSFRHYAQDFR